MSAKPHFRILGIPVRIEPVFWIVTIFFGFNLQDARLIITWVAVVLVSILVHELGHAVALKLYGQQSSIVLHGFGGVTISHRRLDRVQSIVVSLAGPFTALLLLGIPAMMIRDSDYGFRLEVDYFVSGQGFGLWPVVYFAVYVNIWWSIANLLPIRPLDGGHVTTELIGLQPARMVSIVVGAGAAVWAYFYSDEGLRYAAFFAAFLAFINLSEYRRAAQGTPTPSPFDIAGPVPSGPGRTRSARRAGRPTGPPTRTSDEVAQLDGGIDPASAESFAWNLLRRGDARGAGHVLGRATGPVGPFVAPTVSVAAGEGIDRLVAAYTAHPSGPSNLVPATIVADRGQALDLARRLSHDGPGGLTAAASVQTHLHYAERYPIAAAVGEIVFAAAPPDPQVAYDTACSWARAGDGARALEWIERSIAAGFSATNMLDGEPDLEAARDHPRWPVVRAGLTP